MGDVCRLLIALMDFVQWKKLISVLMANKHPQQLYRKDTKYLAFEGKIYSKHRDIIDCVYKYQYATYYTLYDYYLD